LYGSTVRKKCQMRRQKTFERKGKRTAVVSPVDALQRFLRRLHERSQLAHPLIVLHTPWDVVEGYDAVVEDPADEARLASSGERGRGAGEDLRV
jgi:hypothetical protein